MNMNMKMDIAMDMDMDRAKDKNTPGDKKHEPSEAKFSIKKH